MKFQDKIFVCKECGARCDVDEFNHEDQCIDCQEWDRFEETEYICKKHEI